MVDESSKDSLSVKSQQARARVLSTAARLMRQRGIKPVTMSDIASESNTSKRTIYQMFESKVEVIQSVLYEDVACAPPKSVISLVNPMERLLAGMSWGIEEASGVNQLFYADMQRIYPDLWAEYHARIRVRQLEITHEQLEVGIEMGVFRPDIDPQFIATLLIEAGPKIFHLDVFHQTEQSIYQMAWEYLLVIMRGIATPEGVKVLEEYLEKQTVRK